MLEIELTERDNGTVLKIDGEVDLYSSPQVREKMLELIGRKVATIMVDMSAVSYMDSSGLATLIEGYRESAKYGGKLVIIQLRDTVREVFELSKLDKVFMIFDSLEDAEAQARAS